MRQLYTVNNIILIHILFNCYFVYSIGVSQHFTHCFVFYFMLLSCTYCFVCLNCFNAQFFLVIDETENS